MKLGGSYYLMSYPNSLPKVVLHHKNLVGGQKKAFHFFKMHSRHSRQYSGQYLFCNACHIGQNVYGRWYIFCNAHDMVFMQGKALAAGHYTCQPRVGCSLHLAHLFVIKLLECTQLVNRSGPLTYLAFVIDWCESSECVPFEEYHSWKGHRQNLPNVLPLAPWSLQPSRLEVLTLKGPKVDDWRECVIFHESCLKLN